MPYRLLFRLIRKFNDSQMPCADLSIFMYSAPQPGIQLDLEVHMTSFCSFICSFTPLHIFHHYLLSVSYGPNAHSVIHLCEYILFTGILGETGNDRGWLPGEKQAGGHG